VRRTKRAQIATTTFGAQPPGRQSFAIRPGARLLGARKEAPPQSGTLGRAAACAVPPQDAQALSWREIELQYASAPPQ
jgi:hypothetical protein